MMKHIKIVFFIALSALTLAGCAEDYLEKEPLNKISSAAVFENEGYTEALLYDIYSYMPNGFGWESTGHKARGYGRRSFLDCTTDIIANKSGYVEAWRYVEAGQSATQSWEFSNWNENYTAIFECNTLIEGINGSSLSNSPKMQLIKSEARFLRAFFYFDLVRRYGGVPLITEVPDISNVETLYRARTAESEIYDFINTEFTEVVEMLPLAKNINAAGSKWGRVCKEAVWGFHGRMLLHAKRYAESATMSKKVIDAVNSGESDREMAADYEALFISKGNNKEVLFEILFDGVNKGGTVDNFSRPPSNRGSWGGQHNPTEDLVASYELANGLPATIENGHDPQNPYVNRDPRLSQTVLHHGSTFFGRTYDFAWVYDNSNNTWGPIANTDAPHAQGLATITGYYLRKFMDPDVAVGDFGMSSQSWIVLRLGEVYLNYAEAQNEAAGPDQSVYDAVNVVRNRSNMPDLEVNYPGLDKTGMFERIKHERKVELAFEGHRFWDIRRWRIGDQICNGSVPINPLNPQEGGYVSCCYPLKQADGSIMYLTPSTKDDVLAPGDEIFREPYTNFRRAYIWNDRNYLMPIPQAAMDRNPELDQNPGY
ncbi:RagB/SusD family nutrient uptake outer membrane protein [Seonamhaeicola algicola]|uniref:RagB/SusD family nutrient uptake outer membrane protein n=1 Tax=Seonamhaeicola algicola TaxID=1719036 RepID=A0A5C7ABV9_9FLAO|nr:RagB/SusD family nutrient uptake outer membrane protein [Seonamhaeicola algicola]TXE06290.1 RagB/SusD family nutrient uptake outer membrane protein [Seonamhaeicola algicola]